MNKPTSRIDRYQYIYLIQNKKKPFMGSISNLESLGTYQQNASRNIKDVVKRNIILPRDYRYTRLAKIIACTLAVINFG